VLATETCALEHEATAPGIRRQYRNGEIRLARYRLRAGAAIGSRGGAEGAEITNAGVIGHTVQGPPPRLRV